MSVGKRACHSDDEHLVLPDIVSKVEFPSIPYRLQLRYSFKIWQFPTTFPNAIYPLYIPESQVEF